MLLANHSGRVLDGIELHVSTHRRQVMRRVVEPLDLMIRRPSQRQFRWAETYEYLYDRVVPSGRTFDSSPPSEGEVKNEIANHYFVNFEGSIPIECNSMPTICNLWSFEESVPIAERKRTADL